MKMVAAEVGRSVPLFVEEVDISRDPGLEARYGQEIPVLEVNGRKAAKYRITEAELLRIVSARAMELSEAG
jgi:hypothetical protein